MTIKQYQDLMLLDSGSTTYEYEVVKCMNLKMNLKIEDIQELLKRELEIKEYIIKNNRFYFNKKLWSIDKDFLDGSFEQFIRVEQLVAEENNIQNLHTLFAIYCRPMKYKFIKQKFDSKMLEDIEKELLELPMDIAQAVLLFFYHVVQEYMRYITIPFLNKMNSKVNLLTTDKLKK
jgi:hypothetical protein